MTLAKMLRCDVLIVLVLIANVHAFHVEPVEVEAEGREKRQTVTIQLRFPVRGPEKATFLVYNDRELVQLTGRNTDRIDVTFNQTVSCDLDGANPGDRSVTIVPDGMSFPGISECSRIEGFQAEIFTRDQMFSGPGVLYRGPNRALFIAANSDRVSALIEANRPNFPTPIEPVESIFHTVMNMYLVLNNDNTDAPDGVPDSGDSSIVLTGSNCMNLQAGDAVIYLGGTISIRRGSTQLDSQCPASGIGTLDAIETTRVFGVECQVLTRVENSLSRALSGPGLLCCGDRATSGGQTAFFTNYGNLVNQINQRVVQDQLSASTDAGGTVTINRVLEPNAGTRLVTLNGAQSLNFPTATQVVQSSGVVQIQNSNGDIIQVFMCFGVGVSLAAFTSNQVSFSASGNLGPLNIPGGGLSMEYNPSNCSVFVYPTQQSNVGQFVSRAKSNVTVPSAISFGAMPDGFGGVILTANGNAVFGASTSRSFPVGEFQTLIYQGMNLNIQNIRMGDVTPTMSFSGVQMFTTNTGSNRLEMFMESAVPSTSGPGTLYVDDRNRAFFTNSASLMMFIQDSISSSIGVPINIGGQDTIELSIGGNNLFTFDDSSTLRPFIRDQGFAYQSNTIARYNGFSTPSGSTIQYFSDPGLLRVIDSGGNLIREESNVNSLLRHDGRGMFPPVSVNSTFSGGGTFMNGSMSLIFLPNNLVGPGFQRLTMLGALTSIASGVGTLVANIGGRTQTFMGGSPTGVFNGPGSLFSSNESYFFTTDDEFITRIMQAVSNLRPVTTFFNRTTGLIQVISGGREIIAINPSSSRTISTSDSSTVTITGGINGGNISIDGNFISGGIRNFVFNDGITYRTIDFTVPGEMFSFRGGGGMIILSNGMGFFSSVPSITQRIMFGINEAGNAVVPPVIPTPFPASFVSKENLVDTRIGQSAIVYQGADVNIDCSAGAALPPASFAFSVRPAVPNNTFPFVPLNESSDVIFTSRVNGLTVGLQNLRTSDMCADIQRMPSREYRCTAANSAGSASGSTFITVRCRDNFTVISNFLIPRRYPGEPVVVARTTDPQKIRPILPPISGTIADTSLITTNFSVGCATAGGRPKASFNWFETVDTGMRVPVNFSNPRYTMTSGSRQSILHVSLTNRTTDVYTYTCEASNGGVAQLATASVCPERYDVESDMFTPVGGCSTTCGLGLQQLIPNVQVTRAGATMPIAPMDFFNLVPAGLYKTRVIFCEGGSAPCIEDSFQFVTGEFGNCSQPCDGGVRNRNVSCVLFNEGMQSNQTVEEARCTMPKPSTFEACNEIPCPIYSVTGNFGECSRTCGNGIRSRNVICIQPIVNETTGDLEFDTEMDIDFCTNFSRSRSPDTTEPCKIRDCPVRYQPGAYGPCGIDRCQERSVSCRFFDEHFPAEDWPAPMELCVERGLGLPNLVRSCDGGVCSRGQWNAVPMGSCSAACGFGLQQQIVTCYLSNVTNIINDGFCDSRTRPSTMTRCFLRNCPGRCDFEPGACPVIRAMGCKNFPIIATGCCKSCPLQATPIPPLVV